MGSTSARRVEFFIAAAIATVVLVIPPVRRALWTALLLLAAGRLAHFQQHLLSMGAWAPAISIALMVAEALAVPLPVTILMIANGLVFGTWLGMLVSFIGGLAGAVAAYVVGQRLGREIIGRFLPAASLQLADRLMAEHGSGAIVLGRWIPGVPCDPISYAAGFCSTPFLSFVILSTLGLLPANLLTAYLGSQVAGDVRTRYWVAGLLLVGVVWFVWYQKTNRARRERRLNGSRRVSD